MIRNVLFATLLSFSTLAAAGAPQVNLWVSKDVAPSDKVRINVNTQNVPVVRLSAYPIDGVGWLRHLGTNQPRPNPTGPAKVAWPARIAGPHQRPNPNQADTYYSRQINLPKLPPGVYLIVAKGGGKEAWGVANVTNLAVVVKRSPKHSLVWLTDFQTGRTISGAKVSIFRDGGAPVATVATGRDGVAKFAIAPGGANIVVRSGNDLAGVPSSVADPNGHLVAHFQTDRPIYRPGQTVAFKAILRRTQDRGYRAVVDTPLTLEVRDPRDNVLDEQRLTSNAMGAVAGHFEIPEEGMTGPYSLVLKLGSEAAYQTFTVAEYRKPEFQVTAKPLAPRRLAGETLDFQISAQTYFGTPVPNAQVSYTVRRSSLAFSPPDEDQSAFYGGDGNLYSRDTYGGDAFVANATTQTDRNGKVTIRVPTDKAAPDSTYSISCTVEDASHRQVTADASVPVYAAAIRIGLSTTLQYGTLGSLIPIAVRAIDLDGRPTAATVDLDLRTEVYKSGDPNPHTVILTSTRLKIGANGRGTIQLPARQAGDLYVVASAGDGTGRFARARLDFWVAGNFEKAPQETPEPTLNLRLDRPVYAPGEEVRALATTNRPDRPMLLVLEGQDVWNYRVVSRVRPSTEWKFPASVSLSPNAYVTASCWVKGHFLETNAIVPVPDRTRALKVTVKPDRPEYRPGDTATYRIRTTDDKGRPISAEVALGVIDEAIYALSPDVTPDPYRVYWGQRPNQVQLAISAPEELSGGAYQRVNQVGFVRQRFEDTAYWNPTVRTGANGEAAISFEVPGNLTSWRATARAVTLDTRVGSATSSVLARRDVMLRLSTPRQFVQGDRLTLVGVVDNRMKESRTFEVTLDAKGIELDGSPTQRVEAPGGGQGKVQWNLVAKDLPPDRLATLTGAVQPAGGGSDAERDALRLQVPVVPAGVATRILAGGTLTDAASLSLRLPPNRIEPATDLKVEIRGGVADVLRSTAHDVLAWPRAGASAAADQLTTAAAVQLPNDAKEVREALALLSRTQTPEGWGWWVGSASDPVITARVLSALGYAKARDVRVFANLMLAARQAAESRYNQTGLQEHRALLASAELESGNDRGFAMIAEVRRRGLETVSPYAQLRMASALAAAGRTDDAREVAQPALALATEGPTATFIPVGEGVGWTATSFETTAEAVVVLARLKEKPETEMRMARWLIDSENREWLSSDERAALVRALAFVAQDHPAARGLGDVVLTVNGTPVPVVRAKVGEAATAAVPRELLRDENTISLRRQGEGEIFFSAEARVFLPPTGETTQGVRVLRRFEVMNPAGIWTELDRVVRPSEPVRCTVVAWGDDVPDAIRVVEPIPAGFEYVDGDDAEGARQEVRDGAVVHYLVNGGGPQTFRYYLRAESEGSLTALPATVEYLRRPETQGQSGWRRLEVSGK